MMVQIGKSKSSVELYFPFDTSVDNKVLNLKGYDFLHVKTNGGINPYANRPINHKTIEELLTLTFDDGDKLLINKEYNSYDIADKTSGKLYYMSPALETASVQGGYGELVLITTKHSGIPIMEKHDPYFTTGAFDVIANNHKVFWLGENQTVSMDNLLPYIPIGCNYLCLFIATSASAFFLEVVGYSGISSTTNASITSITTVGEHHIKNANNRLKLDLINQDIATKSFEIHGFFV